MAYADIMAKVRLSKISKSACYYLLFVVFVNVNVAVVRAL